MITYVRMYTNRHPQGRAQFATEFAQYMQKTTEFDYVPVRYFFVLPDIPEKVMWPSHPPIFLDKVRMYSIVAEPMKGEFDEEEDNTQLDNAALYFADQMVLTIE